MKRPVSHNICRLLALGSTLGWCAVILSFGDLALAQEQAPSDMALTGQVSSQEEGLMEGVVISAKRTGSTVTVSVVSNAGGRYSFPQNRMEAGQYTVRIRAVGYEMDDPGPVDISDHKAVQLDLHLHAAKDLADQLSDGEWMSSMPGTTAQKAPLMHCFSCHHLDPVVRSRYSTDDWVQILKRMKSYAQSTPLNIQTRWKEPPGKPPSKETLETAAYLSTINLSSSAMWQYPLKTLPRPKGKATRVIITEYDLPRSDAQPHDAVVGTDGMIWYSDFGHQYMGKLDPNSGKVVDYAVPELRPGVVAGANSLEFDSDGNVWLGMMRQVGIAKFDKTTERFQTWNFAGDSDLDSGVDFRVPMVMPRYSHVDGKVWVNNPGFNGIQRLDLQTGEIESIDPYANLPENSPAIGRPHTVYGIAADSHNNLYFMDFYSEFIGRADAKTGKITLYRTPTFDSRPERGHIDSQDRLWFGESLGNNIGMFDTKTEQIKEWALPTPWSDPYDVVLDKNEEAWTGGMSTDQVVRLDTKTGEFTEYLLPRATNIRRVDVDNSTNPPTFWVGDQQGASIIKLEPLE